MASLFEMLGGQLSGSTISEISRQLGADDQQTQAAVAAALPTMLEALHRRAEEPGGADQLHTALQRDHDGSLLDQLNDYIRQGGQATQQPRAADGDGILGHMLGGKRQRVEQGVSTMSGLDTAQVAKLMAMLAPLVLSTLGRQSRQKNMDQGQLTDYLRRERTSMQEGAPEQASVFGRMLDQDGDGDFDASDMMRLGASMVSRMFRK